MHNIMQKSNDCLGGEGAERDVDKIYLGPSTCHSNGLLFGTASEREQEGADTPAMMMSIGAGVHWSQFAVLQPRTTAAKSNEYRFSVENAIINL